MKKEDSARRLLKAMTEIDEPYIEEAMPKEIVNVSSVEDNAAPIQHVKRSSKETESQTVHQAAEEGTPKVLYMKPKHRWQPVGIVAAAAVLVLGLGVYHLVGHPTAAQTPAELSETGAPAMAKARNSIRCSFGFRRQGRKRRKRSRWHADRESMERLRSARGRRSGRRLPDDTSGKLCGL